MRSNVWFLGLVALLASVSLAAAADWPRFRGPNGSGVSADDAATPVTWSPTDNLKWKVALPGEGVSCPIVVGDRVFVTTYSGYGYVRGGSMQDLERHLVCLNRTSGSILWEKTIPAVLPEDPYSGAGVPQHGYASHTPVSDGERVYAFFGKTGVIAFDLKGTQLWQRSVGKESDPREWGSASSPILVGDIVVVPAGPESRAIIGLNAKTGEQVWEAKAEGLGNVWGTPALVKIDEDRTDVVIGAPYEIWGLNPKTGKLAWFCEAMDTESFNTSVVVQDGIIYAVEGRSGGSIAVRAGGKGDVSKTNVVWSGRDANRFGTPVVYRDRMIFVSNGIVNCLDTKTGSKVYQSRLPSGQSSNSAPASDNGARPGGRGGFGGRGGSDYSSPVAADGKIYFITGTGDMHVFAAGDQFESLAVNRVTDDNETFAATPAISHGELFIRSNKHLYCVSETK
ncbi:PQQ-binding-like beta-propeller repeat protein [bacterium]|nr:PQQ-binding-like beta-propeller repeat protein [bacterium]